MTTSITTIRRRLLQQLRMKDTQVEALTKEIATLRVAAYEGRLQQVADDLGLDVEPSLTDDRVLRRIARESQAQAKRIAQTYHDALYGKLSDLPKGISQREAGARLRAWRDDRAESKAKTIARVEGMIARGQADQDIISKNQITGIKVRVTPKTAAEARCARLIGRGWINQATAPDLPLHVGCIHGYEYDSRFTDKMEAKTKVWLGDLVDMPS